MGWESAFFGVVICWTVRELLAQFRPEGYLGWKAEKFRRYWRSISRRLGGRPRIDEELIELIRRISLENPLWGAPRIHGELKSLGRHVAQSTVSKYMVPRRGRSPQGWLTFLRNNFFQIVAIDMLTVRTNMFECLYVFVVLGLGRRVILHTEVTTNPTAQWLANQITEAFPWDTAPTFLIRDNDRAYGQVFKWRVRAMGIRDRPTMPYSPWQNGYAERVIGTLRREFLNHMEFSSARHLRCKLREYVEYYNNDRTHLSLNKDAPNSRVVESEGRIVSRRILGGLHHRYSREPSK